MADKIVIEVYKNKNADEFTKVMSEPESKLDSVSAAASTAALACSLASRAAKIAKESAGDNERVEYIVRNSEVLRTYMVHLIDEDIKSRGPLYRAMKEGGEREVEAARHTACCIGEEVVNMMGQLANLLKELTGLCQNPGMHYIGESARLAYAAACCARLYVVNLADMCSDETFSYVTRRENDILLEQMQTTTNEIISIVEKAV